MELTLDVLALARENLATFCMLVYPGFLVPPHVERLCETLEAVERGEQPRSMITMPPRHSKSLVTSQLFPAWFMGRNQGKNLMLVSHTAELATGFGRNVRNIMQSDIYKLIFPGVEITKDSKAKHRFDTTTKNAAFFLGVGGPITGRGGDCFPAGTMVDTDSGPMQIQDLISMRDHPMVWSFNHKSKQRELRKITATRTLSSDHLLTIKTVHGRTIIATPEHRIWLNGEYTPIGFAQQGDYLQAFNGKQTMTDYVLSVIYKGPIRADVYDIQVEGNHNFFANEILVHNCVIIDDPLKDAEQADSIAHKEMMRAWYGSVLYTRLMPGGSIVLVSTRWREDDLQGWLLDPKSQEKVEDWHQMNFPALAESDEYHKGKLVRRRGAPLWPEKFDTAALDRIRSALGTRSFMALYQQRPQPEEGNIFKAAWFFFTILLRRILSRRSVFGTQR